MHTYLHLYQFLSFSFAFVSWALVPGSGLVNDLFLNPDKISFANFTIKRDRSAISVNSKQYLLSGQKDDDKTFATNLFLNSTAYRNTFLLLLSINGNWIEWAAKRTTNESDDRSRDEMKRRRSQTEKQTTTLIVWRQRSKVKMEGNTAEIFARRIIDNVPLT